MERAFQSKWRLEQVIFQRYIEKYKKYFREQFTRFKNRGDLFQEFSEKGLCKKYILSEIKESEEERKTQEKILMDEIKKRQTAVLELRAKSMKRLVAKTKEYTQKIKKELLPYIKDLKSCRNLMKKEARKLGKNAA